MPRKITFFLLLVVAVPHTSGSSLCQPCHQKQVDGFKTTGMGRSATTHISLPDGDVRNGAVKIRNRNGSLLITAATESFPVAYAIGSGNAGISFLIRSNEFLFQAPPSWYSKQRKYDVSPGFEHDTHLTFERAISSDCLFCHTGQFQFKQGTQNSYGSPEIPSPSITCERCHGNPTTHLENPGRGNIVNPATLSITHRDSVCEQCHLGGEARILNPGKKFEDFQPGTLLESVFSVYTIEPKSPNGLKVVGHAEGMAASACAQKSNGALWCASCHDVHQTPSNQKEWHRQKCLSCHQQTSLKNHSAEKADCAGCHMPRRQSSDGAHTAFTDHRIQIPGKSYSSPITGQNQLSAWRPALHNFEKRNLGLAYISNGEKELSALKLNEGLRLLLEELPRFPNDPALHNAIGSVLMKKSAYKDAVRFFRQAIQAEPGRGANYLNLAAAHYAMNQSVEAAENANAALLLDQGLEEAYRLLILIDPSRKQEILQRYSKALPGRRLMIP